MMFALDGIKVLTLENGISAPFCSRLLGDLGAEVVKIERPGVGDVNRNWDTAVKGHSSSSVWVDRNKMSLELDLKSPDGTDIFLDLAKDADVIIQNFSPGVVERLGLSYDDIKEINPGIIYVNISGYGREGPYKERKAYDLVMQGETGLISMTGSPDKPAKIPLSICDINAGMYGALGAVTALLHRERSDEGQEVDISMFSGILSWLGVFPLKYWYQDEKPERVGMRHHILAPYGPHKTADDQYISFACLSESHYQLFCNEVIDRPDLLEDPRFESNEKRIENRDVFEPIIEDEIKKRPREHWRQKLEAAGLPWGDVNDIEDVVSHPQAEALDMVKELDTSEGPIKFIDNPLSMSTLDLKREPMPDLGEDSVSILQQLGLPDEEIQRLEENGVI